jgi:hypothetical protein
MSGGADGRAQRQVVTTMLTLTFLLAVALYVGGIALEVI